MLVSKRIPRVRYFSRKAINLPQLEKSMGDRSMLIKGYKQVVKELDKSRAICICFYQVSSVASPWHCFTLTTGQVSHSINRTCVFIEQRMRKTTINNREEKSYVHYIKRNIKNSGLSKGVNTYGNGVSVVPARISNTAWVMPSEGKGRQQKYRFKHTAVRLPDGGMSLEQQQLTYDNNNKCTNAYQFLIKSDSLLGSYGKIKSKPGNMTPGIDTITLDGISIKYVENLHGILKDESWLPKPTRRVYLEKSNGKKRPLGISSPRDKIVQESMRIVLENVLEPKFMDCSHGFRPGRSCHSALSKIRY